MAMSKSLATLALSTALATDLKVVTFDGASGTTASWVDINDPVMGGGSTSSFKVTDDKTLVFNGTCAIVKFLQAPGFAKIIGSASYADITGYDGIKMRVRSSTPDYAGFKLGWAAPGIPKTSRFGGASYKAGFKLQDTTDWQIIEVPMTQFSYDWSGYTGRCDTKDPDSLFAKGAQHYCCDKSGLTPSKPEVCVDQKYLSQVKDFEIWAEGVQGDFNIEIDYIAASKADADVSIEGAPVWPKTAFTDCGGSDKIFKVTAAYYKQLNSTTMINGYDATVLKDFSGATFTVDVNYNGMKVASHSFDVCKIAATGMDGFPKCPWKKGTKLHVIDYNPVHSPPYGPFEGHWTMKDAKGKELFCMKTDWSFKPADTVVV